MRILYGNRGGKVEKMIRYIAMATLSAMALVPGWSFAADIKVGSMAGFTGQVPMEAANIHAARSLAAQLVNEAGGINDGDTIRLIAGDGACDPKTAVDAANKLVNVEQVVALLGPTCSGEVLAVAQTLTIPQKIPLITDGATNVRIAALEDDDTVFRVVASDKDQGEPIAKIIIDAGFTEVAAIVFNDDYNRGLYERFEEAFLAKGGKIAGMSIVEHRQASYRSAIASLKGSGSPVALGVFATYGAGGITILKNALEGGYFDKFFGGAGMVSQTVVDQIGVDNLRDGYMFTTPSAHSSTEAYSAFAAIAEKAGLPPFDPYVANGFDSSFLLALAIEKAGGPIREKLPAAIREVSSPEGELILPGEWAKAKELIKQGAKINYYGASGPIDFDEAGDVLGAFAVSTINDAGKLEKKLVE